MYHCPPENLAALFWSRSTSGKRKLLHKQDRPSLCSLRSFSVLLCYVATPTGKPGSLGHNLWVLMAFSYSQTTKFWCLLTRMWWLSVSVELCFCIGYSKLLQISTKNLIQQFSDPSAIRQMKILEILTTWI